MEYTVEVEELPTIVEAMGQSNAAVTVLPIYNNKSLIVVRSEAGTKNVYTIKSKVNVIKFVDLAFTVLIQIQLQYNNTNDYIGNDFN